MFWFALSTIIIIFVIIIIIITIGKLFIMKLARSMVTITNKISLFLKYGWQLFIHFITVIDIINIVNIVAVVIWISKFVILTSWFMVYLALMLYKIICFQFHLQLLLIIINIIIVIIKFIYGHFLVLQYITSLDYTLWYELTQHTP